MTISLLVTMFWSDQRNYNWKCVWGSATPRVSFTRVVLRSSSVQNELTSRLGYFNFPCWHFRRFNNCLNVILSFFVVEFFSGFNHSMTYYAAFFQIYCRCTCFRQLHYCEIRYNIKTSKFSSFVTLFRVIMKNSHEILIFMWIKYLLTNVFAIFIALTKKYGDILWKSVFFWPNNWNKPYCVIRSCILY